MARLCPLTSGEGTPRGMPAVSGGRPSRTLIGGDGVSCGGLWRLRQGFGIDHTSQRFWLRLGRFASEGSLTPLPRTPANGPIKCLQMIKTKFHSTDNTLRSLLLQKPRPQTRHYGENHFKFSMTSHHQTSSIICRRTQAFRKKVMPKSNTIDLIGELQSKH